jgi:hypothetical protein
MKHPEAVNVVGTGVGEKGVSLLKKDGGVQKLYRGGLAMRFWPWLQPG